LSRKPHFVYSIIWFIGIKISINLSSSLHFFTTETRNFTKIIRAKSKKRSCTDHTRVFILFYYEKPCSFRKKFTQTSAHYPIIETSGKRQISINRSGISYCADKAEISFLKIPIFLGQSIKLSHNCTLKDYR
jgi:hypothetical protein